MVALAAGTQGLVVLPVLLLGTLAPHIEHELQPDQLSLGGTRSVAFAGGAIMSIPSGRLAERFGGPRAMRVALLAAMVAQAGMAMVTSWSMLLPFAALAGMAMALAQPASDLWITRRLDGARLGIGIGIGAKQSFAGPGVGLIAGLALPTATAAGGPPSGLAPPLLAFWRSRCMQEG